VGVSRVEVRNRVPATVRRVRIFGFGRGDWDEY